MGERKEKKGMRRNRTGISLRLGGGGHDEGMMIINLASDRRYLEYLDNDSILIIL